MNIPANHIVVEPPPFQTAPFPADCFAGQAVVVTGGGCAGSGSAAIGRLGGRAWLATRLGDDAVGDTIVGQLQQDGVDTSLSPRFPGLRSPVSSILIDAQGERMVVSYTDPKTPLSPDWRMLSISRARTRSHTPCHHSPIAGFSSSSCFIRSTRSCISGSSRRPGR